MQIRHENAPHWFSLMKHFFAGMYFLFEILSFDSDVALVSDLKAHPICHNHVFGFSLFFGLINRIELIFYDFRQKYN